MQVYDIQDKIIEYLDIEDVFYFLMTCKNIYNYNWKQQIS